MRRSVAPEARRDIAAILRRSGETFGPAARGRYRTLLRQALDDLTRDPARPGVWSDPEIGGGTLFYHLRHSRSKVSSARRVGAPSHYIVFRVSGDLIEVMRVLHDAMDLRSHLDDR